jgi:hypothetical protein
MRRQSLGKRNPSELCSPHPAECGPFPNEVMNPFHETLTLCSHSSRSRLFSPPSKTKPCASRRSTAHSCTPFKSSSSKAPHPLSSLLPPHSPPLPTSSEAAVDHQRSLEHKQTYHRNALSQQEATHSTALAAKARDQARLDAVYQQSCLTLTTQAEGLSEGLELATTRLTHSRLHESLLLLQQLCQQRALQAFGSRCFPRCRVLVMGGGGGACRNWSRSNPQ